jgi:hypothetical protein
VTHVTDVYPFDFADIWKGICDPSNMYYPDFNYKFIIKDADVEVKNGKEIVKDVVLESNAAQNASTSFAYPAFRNGGDWKHFYSLPLIAKQFVSNDSKYVDGTDNEPKEILATYCYRNVSLTKNADGTASLKDHDVEPVKQGVANFATALNVNKIELISDAFILTEQGIATSATAAKKKEAYDKFRDNFLRVTYEEGANYNSTWATGMTDKTLYGPTVINNEMPLDRYVYNNPNYMKDYVTKNVFFERAGLYKGTLDNLKENANCMPSLKNLIAQNYLEVVPGSITIDITDYFTPTFKYNGTTGKPEAIILVPTDRTLMHPNLTKDVPHVVSFKVRDVFGFEKKIDVNFTMDKPRLDITTARQK